MISGDVISKISVYDEKIKTARENIDANRKALKQMDEAVDQVMGRSQDEKGADKAVALRRGQAKERTRLLSEITAEQKVITQLSEERAPIAAEVRKVEAEVGPIKYIAAFIYGDNPDTNLLEAAVRWVIILIVIVFDPLAIALVLAANSSRKWDEEEEIIPLPVAEVDEKPTVEDLKPEIEKPVEEVKKSGMTFVDPGEHPQDQFDMVVENKVTDIELPEPSELPKIEPEKSILEQHPYLTAGFDHFKHLEPMVYKPATNIDNVDITNDELEATASSDIRISSDPVFKEVSEGYVIYDGKMISKDALKEMKPQLFKLTADSGVPVSTSFGTQFPRTAHKGDTFIRVDTLPNRVFKFDGKRWFEINKDTVDAYLYDENYIKYLIAKIDNGEYDLDLLSDKEKEQIEHYLNSSK
jgi:hypothetical protein